MSTEHSTHAKDDAEDVRRGFIRTLLMDVSAAQERIAGENSEQHRRETVRTVFAALEGVSWVFREHVRTALEDFEALTPLEDAALREESYTVSSTGVIRTQLRYLPLSTSLRLAVRSLQKIAPEYTPDFTEAGWTLLLAAVETRNRLMHPKVSDDLDVTPRDVRTALMGFFWFLAQVIDGMDAANRALASFSAAAREFIDEVRSDPDRAGNE